MNAQLIRPKTGILQIFFLAGLTCGGFAYLLTLNYLILSQLNITQPLAHLPSAWHLLSNPAYKMPVITAGFVATGIIIGFFLLGAFVASRDRKRVEQSALDAHGSARFATKADLADMHLLNNQAEALYIGAWRDEHSGALHYLKDASDQHALVVMPTGSGKDIGPVVMNLLSWQGSAIIHDLKGKTYQDTYQYRQSLGQNVIRFSPASEDSDFYNPLAAIRVGTLKETGDAQTISQSLLDPYGKGLDEFWSKMADSFGAGLIIYVLDDIKDRFNQVATLGDVADALSDAAFDLSDLLDAMRYHPHSLVQAGAQDMLDLHERQRSDVVATMKAELYLYRDPIVRRAVSDSDFHPLDLINPGKKTTLYLENLPSDKDRLRPVMRLVINQLFRLLRETVPPQESPQCLVVLNEFASLAKMPIIESALHDVREYRLRIMILVQEYEQLKKLYGREEGISGACGILMASSPNNKIETANWLSALTGETTVQKIRQTFSGKRFAAHKSTVSESVENIKRNLLTSDQVLRLPGPKKDNKQRIVKAGTLMVLITNRPLILCEQLLFFFDSYFVERYGRK